MLLDLCRLDYACVQHSETTRTRERRGSVTQAARKQHADDDTAVERVLDTRRIPPQQQGVDKRDEESFSFRWLRNTQPTANKKIPDRKKPTLNSAAVFLTEHVFRIPYNIALPTSCHADPETIVRYLRAGHGNRVLY